MKLLVASIGNTQESFVAKRFEHAAWYLIIDSETHALKPIQHIMPQDRHNAILKASSENVNAVVAGSFGEHSLKLIHAHDLNIAEVHGISVNDVIEKMKSREIRPIDGMGLEKGKGDAVGTTQRDMKSKSRSRAPVTTGYSSDSARGHHHLQQYGGRGH